MEYYSVLLTSADKIKTVSSLSDNAWEKVMFPCMKLAQDIDLQGILGTCLYRRLQEMVYDDSIYDPENVMYKDLLDYYVQNYLVYATLSRMVYEVSFKLTNLGSVISKDEHVVEMDSAERDLLWQQYTNSASSYKRMMQDYLKNNKEAYPELCQCGCGQVKPNLRSSEDLGIWLGGIYGTKSYYYGRIK